MPPRFSLRIPLHLLTALPLAQALSRAAKPFHVYYDSTNLWHRDIRFHWEVPERITVCVHALDKFRRENPGVRLKLIDVAPETTPALEMEKLSLPFTDDELLHARNILLQTHQTELVTVLEERCRQSKEQRLQEGKSALGHMGYIDRDTYVTTETFDVCLRATAAWIRAVDNDDGMAVALTRPPGHHATFNLQNGFSFYNFAAAAAIHAVKYRNMRKVSILDWDAHYGQGVTDIIATPRHRENIRYVSIHQTPAFPYEGEIRQTTGNVMTLPMPPETTWTSGYRDIFETALQFCSTKGEWEPDLVIICAGYDALSNDELASMRLDAVDYGRMSRRLCQHLAEESMRGGSGSSHHNKPPPKLMLGLEGGYQLRDVGASGNLPDAVVETVRALIEQEYL